MSKMIVEVYRNLHTNTWSIRHQGKVFAHSKSVVIDNAKLVVQPGGRKRVLNEKRKNVHAFVRGVFPEQMSLPLVDSSFIEVKYNPYYNSTFVDVNGNPVLNVKRVVLTSENKCFCLI